MKNVLAILTLTASISFTNAIDTPGAVVPTEHTKIVSQCLQSDSFYVPFPFDINNNNDNDSLIIPKPTVGPILIPGANTHQQQNAVGNDGSVSGGCLGCDEVMKLIYMEQANITSTHSQCQNSDQCRLVWASTSLRGGCSQIVNIDGEAKLGQWVRKWDEWFEQSNQKEEYHQRCGYATPRCMVPIAGCIEGKCSPVDESGRVLW